MGELRSASVTLAEIIAYIKQTHQTGRLIIRIQDPAGAAPEPAVLIFDAGHLVDARRGDETGDDLVYRLLGSRGASYSFDRLAVDKLPPTRSVTRVQELLLLGAIGILSEEELTSAPPAPPEAPAPPAPAAPSVSPAAPARTAPARRPQPFRRRNMIPPPPGQPARVLDPPPGDFVAFLDRLERDRVSGYVTWFVPNAEGLLLLYQGQVIDAFWAEVEVPATYGERQAIRRFAAAATADERHVEVHILPADFVLSYAALAAAGAAQDQGPERPNLPALVARLTAARHTGCVRVAAGKQAAYLFLGAGRILGEYRARPGVLEAAPGLALELVQQADSVIHVFTAPPPAKLIALNAAAWPVPRVVDELRRTAQDVLGPKAGPVLSLLGAAGSEPRAIHAACVRAKHLTRVFMGPEKHAELSRGLDRLLAHLQ